MIITETMAPYYAVLFAGVIAAVLMLNTYIYIGVTYG
jgi:hypothetical protein